jgi:hypothetical protein
MRMQWSWRSRRRGFCLAGVDRSSVEGLYLRRPRSRSSPPERADVAAALNLPEDLSPTSRVPESATSGLLTALRAGAVPGDTLFIASDKRRTKTACSQEMLFGYAQPPCWWGRDDRRIRGHSVSVDFIDHYRGQDAFDYGGEMGREEGFLKIVPRCGRRAGERGFAPKRSITSSCRARLGSGGHCREGRSGEAFVTRCIGRRDGDRPSDRHVRGRAAGGGARRKILAVGFGQGATPCSKITSALLKLPKHRGPGVSPAGRKRETT